MRILFVKANKIGSKVICWGLNEPASHVAVEFNSSELIYHSYVTGIHGATRDYFHEFYEVVSEIVLEENNDRDLFEAFFKSIPDSHSYDYPALFYFAWRGALHKFFNRPFPRLNYWQENEGFLCTEITYLLANVLAEKMAMMILPENHDISMISPWKLYQLLTEKMKLESLPFKAFSTI